MYLLTLAMSDLLQYGTISTCQTSATGRSGLQ